MDIVIATNNEHKIGEINLILNLKCNTLLSLKNVGFTDEIIENGTNYYQNSEIKAKTVLDSLNEKKIVIADDSGLEIDHLGGAPGLYSARWGGEDLSQKDKNNKVIDLLKNTDIKSARFISVVCCILPDGKTEFFKGICEGKIIDSQKGTEGFGYDPIFIPEGFTKTFAELSGDIKNFISHRALAFLKTKKFLIYSNLLD